MKTDIRRSGFFFPFLMCKSFIFLVIRCCCRKRVLVVLRFFFSLSRYIYLIYQRMIPCLRYIVVFIEEIFASVMVNGEISFLNGVLFIHNLVLVTTIRYSVNIYLLFTQNWISSLLCPFLPQKGFFFSFRTLIRDRCRLRTCFFYQKIDVARRHTSYSFTQVSNNINYKTLGEKRPRSF